MQAKRCSKCGEEKPLEEFYGADVAKAGRHGRQAYCKACDRARPRSRKRNPDTIYFSHIKRAYGLSRDDYLSMVEAQHGCCASCGDAPPVDPKRRFFHVDHCHTTGVVRGLLCLPCNVALGKLRDDPARILALLRYIT